MTVIYHDSDLKPEAQGKPLEHITTADLHDDVQSAFSYADLVWFERTWEWGRQRKMLKHRNGLFVAEVINDWR